MDETDWLLLGVLTVTTGGFLWMRPVVELPARLGVWLVAGGFAVSLLGATVTSARERAR